MAEIIPDAVLAPLGHAGPGEAATRLARLQAEFAAILQVPRVYVRHQGTTHFLSGSPADTLLFPKSDRAAAVPAIGGPTGATGSPMGDSMPTHDLAEPVRRRKGARGSFVRLADGQSWLLAEPIFRPGPGSLTRPDVDLCLDRFHEQVVLGDDIDVADLFAVGRTLLRENYDLSDPELASLLEVEPGPEAETLARAILESLFGPDDKARGYGDWVRATLLANGLAASSIPASALRDVLAVLMATNRTVPPSQFVDACRAALDRDLREHLV